MYRLISLLHIPVELICFLPFFFRLQLWLQPVFVSSVQ